MVTLGIDAHERSHTVVAVAELGRELGTKTTSATTSKKPPRPSELGRPVWTEPNLGS